MNSLEAWSPLWEPTTFYPRDPDTKYKAEFHSTGAMWVNPRSAMPFCPMGDNRKRQKRRCSEPKKAEELVGNDGYKVRFGD